MTDDLLTGDASSLGHLPDDRWAFDEKVALCFDDMLERSIPQYRAMRDATTALAVRHVRPGDQVVDLGCSRGGALFELRRACGPIVEDRWSSHVGGQAFGAGRGVRFVGLDVSQPMLAMARIAGEQVDDVHFFDVDLRQGIPFRENDLGVALSVLTLQFTPIEYRQQIVAEVFRCLRPGGAFLVVEKVLGSSATLDRRFVDAYYDLKRANGYSDEEIARKRASLEGVLVPVTARWNEEILRSAGFAEVDCFWRWMNFAGWIAVKR